jgi:DUF971 family protein
MELLPSSIARETDAAIVIEWNDGARLRYFASKLRKQCPCATCREKHAGAEKAAASRALPVLSLAEAQPLTIRQMRPVGNYAYNIAFSDGHDSGIFTFDLLRELGEPV